MAALFRSILSLALVLSVQGCPAGWTSFQEMCYYFSDFDTTFPNAASYCLASKGKLAEPQNPETNAFLKQEIMSRGERYFIGVVDYFKEGTWMYASSLTTVTSATSYWSPNEPDANGNEDCTELLPANGRWADCECTLSRRFVCEIESLDGFGGTVIG